MPVHAEGAPDPRGLQLWVDLPKEVCTSSFFSVIKSHQIFGTVQDGGMYIIVAVALSLLMCFALRNLPIKNLDPMSQF
jgi:hypothetical protein